MLSSVFSDPSLLTINNEEQQIEAKKHLAKRADDIKKLKRDIATNSAGNIALMRITRNVHSRVSS